MEKSLEIWNKIIKIGTIIFLVLGFIYYLIGSHNLEYLRYNENFTNVNATSVIADLDEGTVIEQSYINHADYIDGITLQFGTYGGEASDGIIHLELLDVNGDVIASQNQNVGDISDNAAMEITFDNRVSISRDETYIVRVSENNSTTHALGLWGLSKHEGCSLSINGELKDNNIYFVPDVYRDGYFNILFFSSIICFYLLFIIVCVISKSMDQKGKTSSLIECIHVFDKYEFLLKQLIDKEFAAKYRRSYLGIVWVILSPLMSMIIMSAVFSYIFVSNIQYFPVYLILGQVTFNFFSDATMSGVTTIFASGQMIKKVYIPKYIFPISKTIFSFVNYLLSFIPVVIVMIFYRVPVTYNIIYLIIFFFAYFLFAMGISFFLSAMYVFMRDTQYLYNIMITLLSFVTPIFYSASMLSPLVQRIMIFNPLYQFITYIRTIILYGQTPTVQNTVLIMVCGLLSMFIGMTYFFKKQDKFILFI